jgi:polar amino acid transport system permease protein
VRPPEETASQPLGGETNISPLPGGTPAAPSPLPEGFDGLEFATRRHIGRWVAVVVVVIICLLVLKSLIFNPNLQWPVVGKYIFSAPILDGLGLTLLLSAIGMPIGVIIGIVVALMRLSENKLLQYVSSAYIWFFLATPLLVQVIFWFNIAALFPDLSIGLPFAGTLVSVSTNTVITPFIAATLALSLHEGAYMAEIVRAGILSVPHGQIEAAESIGMPGSQAFRRVILPQSLRVIIPPTASRVITFVKNTSLVSVAGLAELLYSAQLIYSRTYETIPLLVVASLWYLLLTTLLSLGQRRVERYFSRGVRGPGGRR